MTQANTNPKSRLTMLMVFGVFILPVALAKLALDYEWFERASTNKGELIQPQLDVSEVLRDLPPKWRILYTLPEQCGPSCENALYSIHQVWLALGREADRAQPLVIVTPSSDVAALAKLTELGGVETVTVISGVVDRVFEPETVDGIYLVDTLNQAMLHYPVQPSPQDSLMASRDILADVRKLLKLSRIG
ncbi:hypothetical protein DXV75_12245 [Alteromonas aestuariivivens]|uniref:Cytochrome oxidase assembly protein n=1 Tax=Alteromonas aestuariivivens TaxID=1938339 RepID=A0A3D8M6Q1_9ALTE|nr:hypothetical protein [Alteromonas aestuariivivens]RDV24842.1 hypothetical protein DXV75_12245 [Alteromonas aestuariivivens]